MAPTAEAGVHGHLVSTGGLQRQAPVQKGAADLATPSTPVALEKKSRFLWLLSQGGGCPLCLQTEL